MNKGLSRRNLFKYMGAGGAATVAAACDQKPEKLIPMLVPPTNFEYTPHTAYQYMSTCTECEAGCGMMVTVRENRARFSRTVTIIPQPASHSVQVLMY